MTALQTVGFTKGKLLLCNSLRWFSSLELDLDAYPGNALLWYSLCRWESMQCTFEAKQKRRHQDSSVGVSVSCPSLWHQKQSYIRHLTSCKGMIFFLHSPNNDILNYGIIATNRLEDPTSRWEWWYTFVLKAWEVEVRGWWTWGHPGLMQQELEDILG